MDRHLTRIRQRTLNASFDFLRAQRAYLRAARPDRRRPAAELKRFAEAVRASTLAYQMALRGMLDHLRASVPSEGRDEEITRAEDSLFALGRDQVVFDDLIARQAKVMARRERH